MTDNNKQSEGPQDGSKTSGPQDAQKQPQRQGPNEQEKKRSDGSSGGSSDTSR